MELEPFLGPLFKGCDGGGVSEQAIFDEESGVASEPKGITTCGFEDFGVNVEALTVLYVPFQVIFDGESCVTLSHILYS